MSFPSRFASPDLTFLRQSDDSDDVHHHRHRRKKRTEITWLGVGGAVLLLALVVGIVFATKSSSAGSPSASSSSPAGGSSDSGAGGAGGGDNPTTDLATDPTVRSFFCDFPFTLTDVSRRVLLYCRTFLRRGALALPLPRPPALAVPPRAPDLPKARRKVPQRRLRLRNLQEEGVRTSLSQRTLAPPSSMAGRSGIRQVRLALIRPDEEARLLNLVAADPTHVRSCRRLAIMGASLTSDRRAKSPTSARAPRRATS